MMFNSLQDDRYGDGTYTYSGAPHAVTGIGGSETFIYDVNGTLAFRDRTGPVGPYHQSYTRGADGRVRGSTRTEGGVDTVSHGLLDAWGKRVKTSVDVDPTDGVIESEAYLPDPNIERRNGVTYKVVWVGGERIAETSDLTIGASSQVRFFFADHQGRQAGVLDLTGVLNAAGPAYVEHSLVRHDPYGNEVQGNDDLMTRGFAEGLPAGTGDELWLGWRLYDPEVGRFLQADTIASATVGMGQGLNRYRYGWNSPTNFADPDGHWEVPTTPPVQGTMGGLAPMEGVSAGLVLQSGMTSGGGCVMAGHPCGTGGKSANIPGVGPIVVGHSADDDAVPWDDEEPIFDEDGNWQDADLTYGGSDDHEDDPTGDDDVEDEGEEHGDDVGAGDSYWNEDDGHDDSHHYGGPPIDNPDPEEEGRAFVAAITFWLPGRGLKLRRRTPVPGSGSGTVSSRAPRTTEDALKHLSPQARRSVRSLQRRAQEHRDKLDAYRRNPDAFDNKGFLKNAPTPEVRERIIQGRIRHLESEIQNFENQIDDLLGGA